MGPHFDDFSRALTRLVDAHSDEPRILDLGRALLAKLVARDDWLPAEFAQPHPQYYSQYLLYCDPRQRFSVVSFVWGPGQKTPIHDHTVWALIGMLRGAEYGERFAVPQEGRPMHSLGTNMLRPGEVDCVSPSIGDIHRVSNAFEDRVSISIHAYGGNIGRINRHVYDAQTGSRKSFISGYTNEHPTIG
ncbi:cysteine dioxygenase [Verminephrobacter eiseniae]|uniref:cysteine dioxygenase family protein n=1 Tax=Verminephrobacter eiseniae TaxID=364317 RepID=UPI002238D511|nr:cysteine dioxygenase [Verminephrobacter eiseniae]MCW5259406.1 cysteine dioxygenase [Verminephrobacter eiseniae]